MNRSHSPTLRQQVRINEYACQGYLIDLDATGEAVEMVKGARRIAICFNGLVKSVNRVVCADGSTQRGVGARK